MNPPAPKDSFRPKELGVQLCSRQIQVGATKLRRAQLRARDAMLHPAGFMVKRQAFANIYRVVNGSFECWSPGLVLYVLSVSFTSVTPDP